MTDRRLALGIDASGAQVGADEYRRAMDIVRSHNRQAVEGVRDLERGIERGGQQGARHMSALSASVLRMSQSFAMGGGSIRGVVAGILQELLAAAVAAQSTGGAISGSMQKAKDSISSGGGIRAEVSALATELQSASRGADGLARSVKDAGGAVGGVSGIKTEVAGLTSEMRAAAAAGGALSQSVKDTGTASAGVSTLGAATASAGASIAATVITARVLTRNLQLEAPQAARAFYNGLLLAYGEVNRQQREILRGMAQIEQAQRGLVRAPRLITQQSEQRGLVPAPRQLAQYAESLQPPIIRGGALQAFDPKQFALAQTAKEAEAVAKGFTGIGTSMAFAAARVGGIGAIAAAVVGLTAAIGVGVKNALELERALTLVAARVPQGNITPYETAAIDLTRELGVPDESAAKAFYAALTAGFSEFHEQQEAATLGLKLFKVEGIDAAQAINQLDNVLDAYGKTAADAEKVTNNLLRAAYAGETTFDDMSRAVGQVGAVAGPLGVKLEDIESILATVAPKAGGASAAAGGLSNFMLQLADSTSALNQELRKQGIEVDATTLRTKGLSGTIAEVARGLQGKEALLSQVFGSPRIARVALSAIEDGGARARQVLQELEGDADTLNEAFAKVELLPTDRIEKLKLQLGSIFTEAGQGWKSFLVAAFDANATTAEAVGKAIGKTDWFQAAKSGINQLLSDVQINVGLIQAAGAVALFDPEEEARAKAIREEAERIAKIQAVLKAGLIPDPGFSGPEIDQATGKYQPPPGPPPNLPNSTSPLGPEDVDKIADATAAAEDLARALDEKVGTALQREIAGLRNSEIELRKKIAAWQEAGVPVDDLQAKLFALANENDRTVGKLVAADRSARMGADSYKRAAIAALEYSQGLAKLRGWTVSISDAQWAGIAAVKAMTKAIAEQVVAGSKAFEGGIGANVKDYQFQVSLIGKTAEEQERLTALRQLDVEAMRLQADTSPEVYKMLEDDIERARRALEDAIDDKELRVKSEAMAHAIADPITQGLEDAIFGFESLEDVAKRTIQSIIQQLFRLNFSQPFNQGLMRLLGGAGGGYSSAPGFIGPPSPQNYMGNVIDDGEVIPHALGGVIGPHQNVIQHSMGGVPDLDRQGNYPSLIQRAATRPIPHALGDIPDIGNQEAYFPMSGGRTGSLREGGRTEAIMPVIARAPTGELGVKLVGGRDSQQGPAPIINNHRNYYVDIKLGHPGDQRSRRQLVDDLNRLGREA